MEIRNRLNKNNAEVAIENKKLTLRKTGFEQNVCLKTIQPRDKGTIKHESWSIFLPRRTHHSLKQRTLNYIVIAADNHSYAYYSIIHVYV